VRCKVRIGVLEARQRPCAECHRRTNAKESSLLATEAEIEMSRVFQPAFPADKHRV
jgi:hypothetical protein